MRNSSFQFGARLALVLVLIGGGLVLPGCAKARRPLVTVAATYSIMQDSPALEAVARESTPVGDTASSQVAGVVESSMLR